MQMVRPVTPRNPLLRSETPEKKIAIQIRKDYKKSVTPFELGIPSLCDSKCPQVMFKVPKTPQEKENQSRIEDMMGEFCDLSSFSCIPCGRTYQTITTLKRHAAFHMDWTRFQCNLCLYKSFHRYEVINHCIIKHNVKESIAGGMVNEKEYVGQLKYFLENEDAASVSSDIDQDHFGDSSSTKDKSNNSSQPDSDNLENKLLSTIDCGTNIENIEQNHRQDKFVENKLQPSIDCDSNIEKYHTKDMPVQNKFLPSMDCDSQIEKNHSHGKSVELNMLHVNQLADYSENSKGCSSNNVLNQTVKESTSCKIENTDSKEDIIVTKVIDPHNQFEKSLIFKATDNKSECSTSAKIITESSSLTKEQKHDLSMKNLGNLKIHPENSTSILMEHEVKEVSNTELKKFSSSEENYNALCKEEIATKPDKILKSGEVVVTEVPSISSGDINLKDSQVQEGILKISEHSSEILHKSESNMRNSNFIVDIDNSSKSADHCTEHLFDTNGVKATVTHNDDEDEIFSKKRVKSEAAEGVPSFLSEYSCPDKSVEKVNSESMSSYLEISEQDKVIESSENTPLQSIAISADNDEILEVGIESEALVDERKIECRVIDGEKMDWEGPDESIISVEKASIHEQTYKDAHLTGICKFGDIKQTNLDMPFSVENDTKPLLKDDPSLDFIGFPNVKDENIGRPSRVKRTVEHKDFVYETKRLVSQTSEYEDDDCIILPSSEEGRSSVRRRSSLKLDSNKKSRNEDEAYKSQSCNGSSLSCTERMKVEDLPVLQQQDSDPDELESPYFGDSIEKRKARLVRRRLDANTHGSLTLHIDGNKSKPSETLKTKNLEKVSESSSSAKSVRKESPTMTRYSSRLKLGSSPLPKKEKRQDTLNTRIITNGQGQSNSVATTNKVKL